MCFLIFSKVRAEIFKDFLLYFWKIWYTTISFWDYLTFSNSFTKSHSKKNPSLKFFKCNIFTILYRIEVGRGKEKKIANWEKPGSWWPKWWMDLEQMELLLPFPFFGGGEHQIKTQKIVKLSQVFRKITFWKKVIFLTKLPILMTKTIKLFIF